MKHIDWKEIDQRVNKLVERINKAKYTNIYGVPRGGLILAVILSHRLKLPLIMDGKSIDRKTLVCDDICDSGETLSIFDIQEIDSCCLYKRYNSSMTPTYYAKEICNDQWLLFPWESDDSEAIQDYKTQQ
jgi:hypoxanthine phosphoribosyltransferase